MFFVPLFHAVQLAIKLTSCAVVLGAFKCFSK